jgi:tetraacyldisaccharide 4'-kinase
MRLIEKVWFEQHTAKWLLIPLLMPLTFLFWLLSSFRRLLFTLGIKESVNLACPVVVVGNIGIGGNGKTPVVVFLVEQLTKHGIKVGVLSRGYGGQAPNYPYLLTQQSTAVEAGDEPILIYQRCQVPVVVGADRIAAAKLLIEQGCQLIISDDGLQHYRLKRDFEICVIDGKRLFGNGFLLPSGPLRESTKRIANVDAVVVNGELNNKNTMQNTAYYQMLLQATVVCNVLTGEQQDLSIFLSENSTANKNVKINAIAGIGDPSRFFTTLNNIGFKIREQQGFIDHQAYTADMFTRFSDEQPLLMTEKDAVKCKRFAQAHWWYLPVDAHFSTDKANTNEINKMLADIMQLTHNR